MLTELIERQGVTYRLDRNERHIYLYGGESPRPYKVSASQKTEISTRYLKRWAARTHGVHLD